MSLQCEGITKNGSRCKFITKDDKYCYFHREKPILRTKCVLGDGHCFWRALSYCLTGDENNYERFIEKCIQNKKEDEEIPRSWVGTGEIPAIARILKKEITLFYYYNGDLIKAIFKPDGNIVSKNVENFGINRKNHPVNIYYSSYHYEPLVE